MVRQEVNIKLLLPDGWSLMPEVLKEMIEKETIFEILEIRASGYWSYRKPEREGYE